MIFEQFYLESLGHASYLVGDEKMGRALLLDPRRDVEVYLESARMHGLRIAYAIDTHGHNDYLSGLSELRLRQDMEVLGSASADLGYDHRCVTDGEVSEMGDIAPAWSSRRLGALTAKIACVPAPAPAALMRFVPSQ